MTKDGTKTPVTLPPDGERYLPEFKGTIELEHLHRYQLARSLAAGLDVLDIACGEGYGTDILAASAKSVVGVDISAPAVEHAKFYYRDSRLFFRVGSATDIPIPDASVDMVVSFETIEHLDEHDRMMEELRRVLRPGGLLMISSPNKLEYTDKPGYSNPFHVKELYTEEFVELVGRYFSNTCHYGQRLSAASLIANDQHAPFRTFAGTGVRDGVPDARYDIVLASDNELPKLPNSAYEIPGSPLEPYAAEERLKGQQSLEHTLERREQALEHAIVQNKVADKQNNRMMEQRDETIMLLIDHLRNTTMLANSVVESKWWRGTRMKRRLSNSLRKRRGKAKKIWPEQFAVPEFVERLLAGESAANPEMASANISAEAGVIPPYGQYEHGPDLPLVKYSDVQEGYVEHVTHETLATVIKAIAFYLPQYHPFPENDEWWGKGFTEWTNVGKAKPVYPEHHQPHCPIHLGYYDLRIPEVMEEQAKLARNYGISGFAYYFYWFAGKLLMEKPLEAMRDNPNVDMPYCMIWANENWTRRWDGLDNEVLIGQDHSLDDSRALLDYLRSFMEDDRYIKVNGKPVFVVYRPGIIPDIKETVAAWREQAKSFGFPGLYIMSAQTFGHLDPSEFGFDAAMEFPPHTIKSDMITGKVRHRPEFKGSIFDYDQVVSNAVRRPQDEFKVMPTAMLSWDNTARKKNNSHIFANFSTTRYAQWLSSNAERVSKDERLSPDEKLIFVNAWNEWAEGTHLEPDQRHGFGYLEATRQVLVNYDAGADAFLHPDIPAQTDKSYAVVAHVHYGDTWPELKDLIEAMPAGSLDVYVTTTSLDTARMISESMPSAHVELVDNRGRDVRPFMLTMQRIAHLNYRAVCKVHGKKSVHLNDGDKTRRSTLNTLLKKSALDQFEADPGLGMLATKQTIIPHDANNMAYNRTRVEDVSKQLGFSFEDGRFIAGTMFWVAPAAIVPLTKLDINNFDVERGLADNTLAHAIERVFVNLIEQEGYRLAPL